MAVHISNRFAVAPDRSEAWLGSSQMAELAPDFDWSPIPLRVSNFTYSYSLASRSPTIGWNSERAR